MLNMATRAETSRNGTMAEQRSWPTWLSAASLFGAIAASSCCLVPLVLFLVGISGAWISNLTALAPCQPYFVAFTLACLGGGFALLERKPNWGAACVEGSACASPTSSRIARIALWSASVLIAVALLFPYAAKFLL